MNCKVRKNPKAYFIYYAMEKKTMSSNALADYYKISQHRVIELRNAIAYERLKYPEAFAKNFVRATGFTFPVN